jgi:PIN domain nuclease of toxin-antitoxin system
MKYLLDTHVVLWFDADDQRLSELAKEIVGERSNEIYVSIASLWEIQIKSHLGSFIFPCPLIS